METKCFENIENQLGRSAEYLVFLETSIQFTINQTAYGSMSSLLSHPGILESLLHSFALYPWCSHRLLLISGTHHVWASGWTHHAAHTSHAVVAVGLHLVHEHACPSLDYSPPVEHQETCDQDICTINQCPHHNDRSLDLTAVHFVLLCLLLQVILILINLTLVLIVLALVLVH